MFIFHFHTDHTSGIDYLAKNFDIERIFIPVITDETLVESLIFNIINQAKYCVANSFIGSSKAGKGKFKNIIKIDNLENKKQNKEPIPIDRINQNHINHPIILQSPSNKEWGYIPYNIENVFAKELYEELKHNRKFSTAFDRQGKVVIGKLKALII